MKLTKQQLKQIIKEEINNILEWLPPGGYMDQAMKSDLEHNLDMRDDAAGGDPIDMEAARSLADTLKNDPTVMGAVRKAIQDPKVQAAAEELIDQQALSEESSADSDLKKAVYSGGVAGASILSGLMIATHANPSIAQLGFLGGIAAAAGAMLVGELYSAQREKKVTAWKR